MLVRIAGLFKASMIGKVGKSHSEEVRKRCQSCGWVNIYLPARVAASPRHSIEVK